MRAVVTTLVAAGLVLALRVAPCGAQGVSGRMVDERTGQGVAGALVTLWDSAGIRVVGALTGSDGRFSLTAPAPGTYRLHSEAVGYSPARSPPLRLRVGELLAYRVSVAVHPVALGEIVVPADVGGCGVPAEEGGQLQAMWERVRQVLEVVSWSRENRPLLFDIETFRRERSPVSLAVRAEARDTLHRAPGGRPFTTLSPEELDEGGYIRRGPMNSGPYAYYGPDAEVVLSDAFLGSHCFAIAAHPGDPRLVGLAFRPRRARRTSDIEGVLWLRRDSGGLESLEFAYTRVPFDVDRRNLGGRLAFARLGSGEWIISEWWIRAPRISRTTRRLALIEESGARVLRVTTTSREPVFAPPRSGAAPRPARVVGRVTEHGSGAGVSGARVLMGDGGLAATTDSAGRFTIDGVAPGLVGIRVERSGYTSLGDSLSVPAGAVVRVELRMPVEAIPLEPIDVAVEGRSALLEARGFYERRARRPGTFLDREALERFGAAPLTTVPSLRLDSEAAPTPGRGGCTPRVYLNGAYLDPRNAPLALELLSVRDVEGVEIYAGPGSAPPEFSPGAATEDPTRPGGGLCGAIVIWTRQPAG